MKEIVREYNGIKVFIDKGMEDWSGMRKPYYRMRGKPVTTQQAFEIIRRTDSFFSRTLNFECVENEDFFEYLEDVEEYREYLDDYIEYCQSVQENKALISCHFDNIWFEEQFGWAHPDGTIGLNFHTYKWPETDELIEEWAQYLRFFPFLDLVIVITYMNEESIIRFEIEDPDDAAKVPFYKSKGAHFKGSIMDLNLTDIERDEYGSCISVGIWVHDKTIEIMEPERAYLVYKEYEKLYETKPSQVYMPYYYEYKQPDVVSLDYLYKCVEAYGIKDPQKFISDKLGEWEQRILKHLK